MKRKIMLFSGIFLVGLVLIYAVLRFGLGEIRIKRIATFSNTGNMDADVRRFLVNNIDDPRNLPDKMLARFPEIEHVSIKDNYNGVADVHIVYKKIVAVWQDGNTVYPLLENGAHVDKPYAQGKVPANLLYFKGKVPQGIGGIIRAVNSFSALAKRTDYLEHVEGRRWNIVMQNGGIIMLPEQGIQGAVNQVKTLDVIGKQFQVLDLRGAPRATVKQ